MSKFARTFRVLFFCKHCSLFLFFFFVGMRFFFFSRTLMRCVGDHVCVLLRLLGCAACVLYVLLACARVRVWMGRRKNRPSGVSPAAALRRRLRPTCGLAKGLFDEGALRHVRPGTSSFRYSFQALGSGTRMKRAKS